MTTQEQIERLYMAIALIQDADAMVQATLEDTDEGFDLQCAFKALIDDVQDTIVALEFPVPEDDGQPTEQEEWHSFDPDC
jgi:hypothetical protein